MAKPFLLLQSRTDNETSDDEVRAFYEIGGLNKHELKRVRMDKQDYPTVHLHDYSGIIMAGGPANFAYDDAHKTADQKTMERWIVALMDEILYTDKPFLGICLGVGALSTARGMVPSFSLGEEAGAIMVTQTQAGRHDALLAGVPQNFQAVVGHKEGLCTAPDGCVVLAHSATCLQMIRYGNNVYATQFHPELDKSGLTVRLNTYRNSGYCEPEMVESIIESIDWGKTAVSRRVLTNFVAKYRQ